MHMHTQHKYKYKCKHEYKREYNTTTIGYKYAADTPHYKYKSTNNYNAAQHKYDTNTNSIQ